MHLVTEQKFNHLTHVKLENGFIIKHLRSMDFIIAPERGGESLRDCMINKIVYPDSKIDPKHLRYYMNLFKVHACMILVGVVTLVLEFVFMCCVRSSSTTRK